MFHSVESIATLGTLPLLLSGDSSPLHPKCSLERTRHISVPLPLFFSYPFIEKYVLVGHRQVRHLPEGLHFGTLMRFFVR